MRIRTSLPRLVTTFILLVPSAAAAQSAGTETAPEPTRSFLSLVKDLAGDFRRLATPGPLLVLGIGGGLAGATEPLDVRSVRELTGSATVEQNLDPGTILGGGYVQVGTAFGAYALGAVSHKPRLQNVGGDLIEAQAVAGVLTQGLKVSVRRLRPDGSDRASFPSGHASASFATADVLERHFGWKAGVPAYIAAAYISASRLSERQHYLSDVVFGAAIGIASSRSLSVARGRGAVTISPVALRKGVAIMVTAGPIR